MSSTIIFSNQKVHSSSLVTIKIRPVEMCGKKISLFQLEVKVFYGKETFSGGARWCDLNFMDHFAELSASGRLGIFI